MVIGSPSLSFMSFNEEVCHKRLLVICLITNVRLFASCSAGEEEEENDGNFTQPFGSLQFKWSAGWRCIGSVFVQEEILHPLPLRY